MLSWPFLYMHLRVFISVISVCFIIIIVIADPSYLLWWVLGFDFIYLCFFSWIVIYISFIIIESPVIIMVVFVVLFAVVLSFFFPFSLFSLF